MYMKHYVYIHYVRMMSGLPYKIVAPHFQKWFPNFQKSLT